MGAEAPPAGSHGHRAVLAAVITVVIDAGQLIALGRLNLIGLLDALFVEVQVPEAVIRECLARPDNPDAACVRRALDTGQLVACPNPLNTLAGLDMGESATIVRTKAIGAAVLMYERIERQQALAKDLRVTGTLVVLMRARQRGLTVPVGPLIATLRASGQRLSQPLVLSALAAVGEGPA